MWLLARTANAHASPILDWIISVGHLSLVRSDVLLFVFAKRQQTFAGGDIIGHISVTLILMLQHPLVRYQKRCGKIVGVVCGNA